MYLGIPKAEQPERLDWGQSDVKYAVVIFEVKGGVVLVRVNGHIHCGGSRRVSFAAGQLRYSGITSVVKA